MLNERPNDRGYWKNKLEDLGNLPEETLNKEAAWAKLHERLTKKTSGKKAAWYWAAACLILTFLITWLATPNKETRLVKNNIPQKPKSQTGIQVPFSDSMVAITQRNQSERNHLITYKVKNKKQEGLPNKNAAINDSAITKTDVINNSKPQYSSSDNADTVALAVIPAKKKLRVMHINELEKPTEEPNQYVQNNATDVFKTDALTRTVFSRYELSKNASDNTLKIKLSPSN